MRAKRLITLLSGLVALAVTWPVPALAQTQAAGVSIRSVTGTYVQPTPSTARFSLLIENAGPGDAAGVVARVVLPAGVGAIGASWQRLVEGSADAPQPCVTSTGPYQVECALGTVPIGGRGQVNVLVNNDGVAAGTTIGASASVSTDSVDPDPSDSAAVVPLVFAGGPQPLAASDVRIAAELREAWGPSVAEVFVVVDNEQPSPATGVMMIFTVPQGASLRPRHMSVEGGSGGRYDLGPCGLTEDRATMTCTLAEPLRQDQQAQLSLLVVNAALPAGSTVELRVEAVTTSVEGDSTDNVQMVPIAFNGGGISPDSADVGVRATSAPPWTSEDGVATGRFHLTYSGPAPATDVAVTLQVPDGVRLVSGAIGPSTWSSGDCANNGATVLRCTFSGPVVDRGLPMLVPFAAVNVGLPANSAVELIAAVTHGESDPNPANDVLITALVLDGDPVPAAVDLRSADLGLAAEPSIVDIDADTVEYSWTLRSRGPDRAPGVTVVVQLGPGLTFSDASLDLLDARCTWDETSKALTCTSPWDLPPGRAVALSVRTSYATAELGTPLEAEAFVATDLEDLRAVDNRSKQRVTWPETAVAGISVTAGSPLPKTGSPTPWMAVLGGAALAIGVVALDLTMSRRRPDGARHR